MIRDHLVERKWLKQVERKGLKQVKRKGLKEGIKVTHQVNSITWINQSSHFKWVSRMVLGERSLLPSVGACRLWVGKPSVVLGRLTWKWWSEKHLRCLVEGVTAILALGAIKGVCGRPWAGCWAPSRLCGLCRSAWMPSNSLVLARVRIDCEWVWF